MIELRLPTAKKSFEARPRKGIRCIVMKYITNRLNIHEYRLSHWITQRTELKSLLSPGQAVIHMDHCAVQNKETFNRRLINDKK